MGYKYEYDKYIKCNTGNYRNSINTKKYIVVHYTGNKSDTAVANANYFKNNVTKTSAHFFVDQTTTVMSVSPDKTAWSVGGNYTNFTNTKPSYYGIVTNANSISVELCSNNGIITDATIQRAGNLIRGLMEEYDIPISNVVRHYDVTGKKCPGWTGWIDTGNGNPLWVDFISQLMTGPVNNPYTEPTTTVKRGSKGEGVKWVQWYVGVDCDGKFGPATEAAVKTWQTKHGLVADGKVGPLTRTAMRNSEN